MQHSKIGNFYTLVISNVHNVFSQILKGVDPFGKSSSFSVPWDLKFKAIKQVRVARAITSHDSIQTYSLISRHLTVCTVYLELRWDLL